MIVVQGCIRRARAEVDTLEGHGEDEDIVSEAVEIMTHVIQIPPRITWLFSVC